MLLTSFENTVFIRRFILNVKIDMWLTRSYQKPFIVSVPVLCFQIFTAKLISWQKLGLTNAISIVLFFFLIFCIKIIFGFSSLISKYWCSNTILWKFQKSRTSRTHWNPASKLSTLLVFAYFAAIFTMGKSENIRIYYDIVCLLGNKLHGNKSSREIDTLTSGAANLLKNCFVSRL